MSSGYSNAWASPRISDPQRDGNFNQEPAIITTVQKIPKHRKAKIKRIRHPTESYLLLKFIQFLTVFTLNVLLFCICLGLFCTLVPVVLLVRKLISACCVRYNSRLLNEKLRQVNSLDAIWLLPNSNVNNASVSSIFFLMEGHISKEEVCDFLSEKWLYYCGNRKNFRFPKFREFVVKICSGFAWKPSASFQPGNHVSILTDKDKLFLGSTESFEQPNFSRPHDLEPGTQQLWKVTILPKYLESEDTGLLFQMHSSLGDIFSFSRLTLESLGYKTVYLRDRCYPMQQSCLYLSTLFAGPLQVLQRIILPRPKCGLDRASVVHSTVCGSEKTVLWSDPIDFKFVKKIKDITRTKVNIVLMSCLAGALRSFLYKCGEDHPTDVRACVPMDIRPPHAKLQLDNKLSDMFVDLPSGTEGAVPRLWEMRRRMDTFSGIIERYALYGFLKLVLLLFPLSFARRLVDYLANKSSCTVTYIPGPNTPAYLNGNMAKCMTSWAPRCTSRGISMSLVTHANEVRLCLVVHQKLVCDPKLIATEFQREILDLYKHLSNRTLPSHLRVRARQQMAEAVREGGSGNNEEEV